MVFKTWKVPQTPQVSKYTSCQGVAHALIQLSTAQKVVGAALVPGQVPKFAHAAAESGRDVYDLIVDPDGCCLGYCFAEWMLNCDWIEAETEIFQLGLVHNPRTLQPFRLASFAAALTTSPLRFSVSACRQVLYFTNPLASTNVRDRCSGANQPSQLPSSKSRKHPPPSPLSRACAAAVYVLLLIGKFPS